MRCSVPVKNERRVLCVFPHYTPAFGTFNHAYRLMKGVRAFMPPQGLLLIAAYMPQAWPVRFIDENIRTGDRRRFRLGRRRAGQRHARPGAADPRHRRRARTPPARSSCWAGRRCRPRRRCIPTIDYLHIGELGDATDQLIARLDESVARPAAQLRFETKDRLPLQEFPDPGLRSHPAQELPDADAAVLERAVPISASSATSPTSTAGSRGSRRRSRSPPSSMPCASRRGIRRWSISSTTISSATARPPRRCCRTSCAWQKQHGYPLQLRLRGDAQHRQAAGHPRAHARDLASSPSSSASRRRRPMRSRRCARTRTSPCR